MKRLCGRALPLRLASRGLPGLLIAHLATSLCIRSFYFTRESSYDYY